jgi:PBP1b-binding outer membrane lipoprotein LpoB
MKRSNQIILYFVLLIFLTSCQSAKDTIKEIKDAKVTTKPKLEKPDSITIKVCCK